MTGSGLTVSKGTTPEPFQVTVQGVLEDGIAPGVDMIVVEADSPTLDRVGGIWAGMSGSPVYADDGRIIGAVAYGFSLGPSKIGGITPAEEMLEVLDDPAQVQATRAKEKLALPEAMQRELVASGAASEQQVEQGLGRLPLPLGVSGANEQRLQGMQEELARRGLNVRVYRASAAGARSPVPPSARRPWCVPGWRSRLAIRSTSSARSR
ncbi:MAG: hypothetical protein GEV03_03880 [Streptosporangiales bacterium]|nr:hypothetical protein [Streptosporangiales bacterium]